VDGVIAVPARQDALNGASVEVHEGLRGQAKFLQPPEVEKALLHLFHHTSCVKGPFQVFSEELEAFDPLQCGPVFVDEGVLSLLSPIVHDQILRFVDFEVIFLESLL
jgi:hypothetical protein